MNTTEGYDISSWTDGLRNYAEQRGYFWHSHKLSDEFEIHEIYSPVCLFPWTTLWRVAVLGVAVPQCETLVSSIPQGFLEYIYQANAISQILASNRSVDKGLLEFLETTPIIFVNLSDSNESDEERGKSYEAIIGPMFPKITKESIDNTIRSKDEHNPFLNEHSDFREFLKEAVFQSAITARKALGIIPTFIKPETDDKAHNSTSISIEPLFYVLRRSTEAGSHNYIFPNKYSVTEQIASSANIISVLSMMSISTPFDDISNAVMTLNKVAIEFCVELLFGDQIHSKLSDFKDGLFKVATDPCLSLMVDDFDSQPFDVQKSIIQLLAMLNRGSDVTKKIFLDGARSRVKEIALLCISLLSDCGYREAIPVLQELQKDKRHVIRSAAESALRDIKPRDDPFELHNRKKPESIGGEISLDEGKRGISNEMFSEVCSNAFYPGPRQTHIHVSLFSDKDAQAIATTHHKDGTFDIAMGNKFGLFSYVAGVLTGQITQSDERRVGMGEAAIMHPDGTVEKIPLRNENASEKDE